MEKIPGNQAQAEKNRKSSAVPRAKPIPRELIRTNYRRELATRGGSLDALLTMEASTKLSPERFFALLAAILEES